RDLWAVMLQNEEEEERRRQRQQQDRQEREDEISQLASQFQRQPLIASLGIAPRYAGPGLGLDEIGRASPSRNINALPTASPPAFPPDLDADWGNISEDDIDTLPNALLEFADDIAGSDNADFKAEGEIVAERLAKQLFSFQGCTEEEHKERQAEIDQSPEYYISLNEI